MDTEKTDKIERRCIESEGQEMRLNYDGRAPVITGYAAKFNQWTELYPGFFERIAPGAFNASIRKDDVRALINHDPSLILGRNKAQTLKLKEDEVGLNYEIIPPDTSAARDLMISIKRGDVTQSSFGFRILKRTMEIDEKKNEMRRTVQEAMLLDVSPVTYPAYPSTEVHVRMTKNDKNEFTYFVEDRAIESVPLEEAPAAETPEKTHEEFMNGVKDFLKASEL
jgi:uncharacterized protein